jgi:hypothetical protein
MTNACGHARAVATALTLARWSLLQAAKMWAATACSKRAPLPGGRDPGAYLNYATKKSR